MQFYFGQSPKSLFVNIVLSGVHMNAFQPFGQVQTGYVFMFKLIHDDSNKVDYKPTFEKRISTFYDGDFVGKFGIPTQQQSHRLKMYHRLRSHRHEIHHRL